MKVKITIAGYSPMAWACMGILSYSAWSFTGRVLDSATVQTAYQKTTAMHVAGPIGH